MFLPQSANGEFQRGWPVILACFCVAIFAWGFGFYGQAVYLAELQRLRGWPAGLISSATTSYYLMGALLMPFVHTAVDRLGPRLTLLVGIAALGGGACGFSRAAEPWQLFAAGGVMALGWASTTGTAIATILALWFDARRGLAISLALNGASASGFTVAPTLVALSHAVGLPAAVSRAALVGLVLLVPIVLSCVGAPPPRRTAPNPHQPAARDERPGFATKSQALRDRRFWLVALPFALALCAQVGFIVHMVAFLLPRLGATGAGLAVSLASLSAMLGRLALGAVIDGLNQRRTSAISFASQAVGLGLMLMLPGTAWALYLGCVLLGLSVGNVITLPAILIHREFAARSFGLLVGLSAGVGQFMLAVTPGLFGVLHDITGTYTVVLIVCISLQITASGLILGRR